MEGLAHLTTKTPCRFNLQIITEMTFKKILRQGREEILDKHIGEIFRTKDIKKLLDISQKTHLQDCAFRERLIKLDLGIYKISQNR